MPHRRHARHLRRSHLLRSPRRAAHPPPAEHPVGLPGRAAFGQGLHSAILGLLLHYFIATTVATIYISVSRRLPLSRHPFLLGSLYGIAVYIMMNYVVIPFSKIGPRPTPPLVPLVNGVAALIFCIGIPIALSPAVTFHTEPSEFSPDFATQP